MGTKAWHETTGKHMKGRKWLARHTEFCGHMADSWNLHPTGCVRDAWILGADHGCIRGNPSSLHPPVLGYQPEGGAKWISVGEQWTTKKKGVPRIVGPKEFYHTAQASLSTIAQGGDMKAAQDARKTVRAKFQSFEKTQRKRDPAASGGAGTKSPDSGARTPKSQRSGNSGGYGHSQSLPTLAYGSFPPTPAYVRHFMKKIDLEQPDND